MTDWKPHRLEDRRRLAKLVEQYGPPVRGPRPTERWNGGTQTYGGGWPVCLWCDTAITHGGRHAAGCPVDHERQARWIAADLKDARREVEIAVARLDSAQAKARTLGVDPGDGADAVIAALRGGT
jgi:hypothetical protein